LPKANILNVLNKRCCHLRATSERNCFPKIQGNRFGLLIQLVHKQMLLMYSPVLLESGVLSRQNQSSPATPHHTTPQHKAYLLKACTDIDYYINIFIICV